MCGGVGGGVSVGECVWGGGRGEREREKGERGSRCD